MPNRSRVEHEISQLREMPVSLWLILFASVAFLAANVVTLMAIGGVKIDPGTATLFGAIVGLGVVAWQANLGFRNLIRSQENQSRLEREASQADENRERRLLLSGLRAEMVSLHSTSTVYASTNRQFAVMYKLMHEHKAPAVIKELTINGYKAPFYEQVLSKIGLLNVSLAADIIKVHSMMFDDRKVEWATPAPNYVVSVAYATGALLAYKLTADLYHVAMRIRSVEEGTEDPGTLSQTETVRHANFPKLEDLIPKEL